MGLFRGLVLVWCFKVRKRYKNSRGLLFLLIKKGKEIEKREKEEEKGETEENERGREKGKREEMRK